MKQKQQAMRQHRRRLSVGWADSTASVASSTVGRQARRCVPHRAHLHLRHQQHTRRQGRGQQLKMYKMFWPYCPPNLCSPPAAFPHVQYPLRSCLYFLMLFSSYVSTIKWSACDLTFTMHQEVGEKSTLANVSSREQITIKHSTIDCLSACLLEQCKRASRSILSQFCQQENKMSPSSLWKRFEMLNLAKRSTIMKHVTFI